MRLKKFMQAELIKLVQENQAKAPKKITSYIELDYSTFKAKKIKQIELVSTKSQGMKTTKLHSDNRIIASPLTLVKPERAPLSPIKNFNVPCIDEHSRPGGWSLGIEQPREKSKKFNEDLPFVDRSQNLPPSIGPDNNFWSSQAQTKENQFSNSKQNIGFASGKKISKIRDESELTPQKLVGDMVINLPKESVAKQQKKTPEKRTLSPIIDIVKGVFSSGYNFFMGSRSKEKPVPQHTPDFAARQPSPRNQQAGLTSGNLYLSGTPGGGMSKVAALLTLPVIAERLSERIERESKKPRFSEMYIEQKLSEEFAKQGGMHNPELAMQRVTLSLRASSRQQRDSQMPASNDLLNKSMINHDSLGIDEYTKMKRGSLSRTPFKPVRSVSVVEDSESKAFLDCLNHPGPDLEQLMELRRSESMPVQSSTNASSDLALNLSQNLTPHSEHPGIINGFSKSPFGTLGPFALPMSEDAQQIRPQNLSLEPSREEDTSQYIATTAAKNYFAAAQLNAQAPERESSMGYELSDCDETDDSDPDHDKEDWRDPQKLADCKSYSQSKNSKILLDEIRKYCGPGYMYAKSELNPNDHRVKMAYTALNLSESQFLSLLERQKTPQKAGAHDQNKVLFINNKRVPQWASDKEVVRKTVLAQNAFGHYRTVFRKMKPVKEFNISEFFPGLSPQVLKNYHR